MLTLLAAAMSTLSAQFHVIGTAIGRDLYQEVIAKGAHQERTVPSAKGISSGSSSRSRWPSSSAAASSPSRPLFFGMCAAAFLPLFVAALFWKRATKAGAITG